MEIESKSGYRNSGRKAGEIIYKLVTYNGAEYVVGEVTFLGFPTNFVIDKDDFDKVKERAWHCASANYIGSAFASGDGKRRELYLHNLIMDRELFLGKGSKETVDHINRNGFDNRKVNLRIMTQSQQNINRNKIDRKIILPEDCGIDSKEIPKHIWYVKANGGHGDRFAIEFKSENFCWKGTSSKTVDIKIKLEQAKGKLKELYIIYPHLNPEYENELISKLNKEYKEICDLAKDSASII